MRPPNDGQTLFAEGRRHFRHAGAGGLLRAPAAQAEFQRPQHGQSSHYTPPKTHAPDIIEGEWERKRE